MREVPFYPLPSILKNRVDSLNDAFARTLAQGFFVLGPKLYDFEKKFGSYIGTEHCVGVSSGHDALVMGLECLGIGPGDEVILPALTFVSTCLAVLEVGATPILVDVDPLTRNIDTTAIENSVTKKTKALLVVHLYGRPCDMTGVERLAKKYSLRVIEDCAQAHGATFDGRRVGTFSDLSAFSFYPTKNLGALGDGGAVCTNSIQCATAARALRNYGSLAKYYHNTRGRNSRLDELQAAFLAIQLDFLDQDNDLRAEAAATYSNCLDTRLIKIPPADDAVYTSAWHLYVIEVENRDALRGQLANLGIGTELHYPMAIHQQNFFQSLYTSKARTKFPNAEKITASCLSLPAWPGMSQADIEYVAEQVNRYVSA